MPYRTGEDASPAHSPPIGTTPSMSQTRTQQPAYSVPAGLVRPQPQLPQNAAQISAMVAACVANGQMTNGSAAQTLLHHHLNQQQSTQISPLRIRINSPTRINSTSSSSSDHVIRTSSSPTIPGTTFLPQKHSLQILNGSHLSRMSQMSHLHRPFESPSSTSLASAAQTRHTAKETAS